MMSDKMPHMIFADHESLIKKIDEYASNQEHFSTKEIGYPCGYSM